MVHAWFGIPSGFLAKRLGLPYIVSLRGGDVPGYNQRFQVQYVFLKPVIKRVWRDADAVVANSEGLKQLALRTLDVDIDVIPNGVDVDEFRPRYKDYEGDDSGFEVLCVSRLIERKGIHHLIKAVADMEVVLTLVGEGNQVEELEELVEELGITNRVGFAGYVAHDEIAEYYQDVDIYVLPSLNEGMSNTVLEAMASGLPIVTTDTGGTDELVDNNGFVVPKEDSDELEKAIRTHVENPGLIEKHGRRSRGRTEEMSWKAVADRYRKQYKHLYTI